MSDLEFLVQLGQQLREVKAQQLDARDYGQPERPRLTAGRFADSMDVVSTTVKNTLVRIEKSLETYLVPRIDKGALKVNRRKVRSNYPEDTARHGGERGKGRIDPELTLDGEIWALYADMVLRLHALTKRATAPYPKTPSSEATKQFTMRRGFGAVARTPQPVRPSEASRARFLIWLQHQHDLVVQAEDFLRNNRYAKPSHLERLVPGYQAAPDEEPLWDPDDLVQEYDWDEATQDEHRG